MSVLQIPSKASNSNGTTQPPAGDAKLLAEFLTTRDEAAFSALVDRYGAMVLAVAHRIVRDRQTAEDVFQATFLVLARDGSRLRRKQALGAWLHGVALRLARRALRRLHRVHRTLPSDVPASERSPLDEIESAFQQQVLDEELSNLPDRYRAPIVLHFLEGKTYAETAELLGVSHGVIEGRLKRGKRELRLRLVRRGVGLGTALAAISWSQTVAQAGVEGALAESVVVNGLAAAAHQPFTPSCTSEAVHLAGKEITMLTTTKLGLAATGLIIAAAAGWWGHGDGSGQAPAGDFAAFSTLTVSEGSSEDATVAGDAPSDLGQITVEVQNQQATTLSDSDSAKTSADGQHHDGQRLTVVYPHSTLALADQERMMQFLETLLPNAIVSYHTDGWVIRATDEEHGRLQDVLKQLDEGAGKLLDELASDLSKDTAGALEASEPVSEPEQSYDPYQYTVFDLNHANPVHAARIIRTLTDNVRVEEYSPTNSIYVDCHADDINSIAEILRIIDRPAGSDFSTVASDQEELVVQGQSYKLFNLPHPDAIFLVKDLLRTVPTVLDQRTNLLFVSGSEAELQAVESIFQQVAHRAANTNGVDMGGAGDPTDESETSEFTVIDLEHAHAGKCARTIKQLFRNARINEYRPTNSLFVRAPKHVINSIKEILEVIDRPARGDSIAETVETRNPENVRVEGRTFAVFELNHVRAEDVAMLLANLVSANVVTDAWTNLLFVSGTDAEQQAVTEILQQIDTPVLGEPAVPAEDDQADAGSAPPASHLDDMRPDESTERDKLELYRLRFFDAETAAAAVRALVPSLTLELDARTNSLIVLGPDEAHRQIGQILEQIDVPSADVGRDPRLSSAPTDNVAVTPKRTKTEQVIIQALDDKTVFEFPGTPLRDVADWLSESHDFPILLDVRALEEAGLTRDSEVNFNLRGVTLRSGLKLMLDNVEGVTLTYVIDDEVLKITTPEQVQRTFTTKTYDVRPLDLVDGQLLVDLITRTTSGPWRDMTHLESPAGDLAYLNGSLVVRQTYPMHVAIEELLNNLLGQQADRDPPVVSEPQFPTR